MKRILYVWKGIWPWDIRVDKFCKTLSQENYEIILLARSTPNYPEFEISDIHSISNPIKIIRVGTDLNFKYSIPISSNPIWRKSIKKTIIEYKPDLIIVREIMLASATAFYANKYNIPIILDMAEHYPAAMKDFTKYKNNFFGRLLVHKLNIPEKVEAHCIKSIDGIITVCEEQINRLKSDYKSITSKMTIVHNTPELDLNNNIRIGSSNPPRVFGHHGWISSEKNLDIFVKGFILAANKDENIELLLSGSGSSYEEIKNIVDDSDVKDRIRMPGEYSYSDLKEILSQVDIGVIPYNMSLFNNTTIHNKIFDYFAAGKPVLTSEAEPLKRLINGTKAGISIDCSSPEIISENILNFKNYNLESMSQSSLKAFQNKYNWTIDSMNLLKFIRDFL